MIDQLEVVNSALYQIGQTEHKGHQANDQHEQLVIDEFVLDPVRKAVLNGRDDYLDDGELKNI